MVLESIFCESIAQEVPKAAKLLTCCDGGRLVPENLRAWRADAEQFKRGRPPVD
jgi:hypothetical protein